MRQQGHSPPATLQASVHKALKQWHQPGVTTSPLDGCFMLQRTLGTNGEPVHAATNRLLLQALHLLEERRRDYAALLRRSYIDNLLDRQIFDELNVAESTFYRRKINALRQLTEALWGLEQEARAAHRATLLGRLDFPTYSQVIGADAHLRHLQELLTSKRPPWIVALTGIGGIGKTTWADATVRCLIDQFDVEEVGWVTARTRVFDFHRGIEPVEEPALTTAALLNELAAQLLGDPSLTAQQAEAMLRHQLKARPHLVVIDNLESVSDLRNLLGAIRELANPTKFLLTARARLYAEPDVYTIAVNELDVHSTRTFIREEAGHRNVPSLVDADDAVLQPILDTIGGNPLAIRLVVGQVHVHGLDTVVENLNRARGRRIEDLYTFIYRQAWDQLDEGARQAWLAMQLVTSHGATVAEIAEFSALDEHDLNDALETLVHLNLIDGSQSIHARRYTIHSLTRTFLREQVLKWS